jgi:hypothetical protein
MVKILDNYYFKELEKAELDRQVASAVTRLDNINTWSDVENFFEQH